MRKKLKNLRNLFQMKMLRKQTFNDELLAFKYQRDCFKELFLV